MIKTVLIIFAELLPFIILAALLGLLLHRISRPQVAAYGVWKRRRQELAAAVTLESHRHDNMAAMLEAQGQLAAHDDLKPELPRWLFWIK